MNDLPQLVSWMPKAPLDYLRARAVLLRQIREFFESRGVLEIETPVLCRGAVGHAEIGLFQTRYRSNGGEVLTLRSSPEAHMKRLIAAGVGSIFQVGKAFRDEPQDALHNPEFTILEYYRVGWTYIQVMEEVGQFLQAVIHLPAARRCSFADAFREYTGLDPFADPVDRLLGVMETRNEPWKLLGKNPTRARVLAALMDLVVQPQLLEDGPVFVYDYPVTHGCLARIRPGNPPVAEKFEVFYKGVELANGCQELTDPGENSRLVAAELAERATRGYEAVYNDMGFLAATAAGLPMCSGVAMGVDRLAMIVNGTDQIDDVVTFPVSSL